MAKRKKRALNCTSKKDWGDIYLKALSETGNVQESCRVAKISRRTPYERQERDKTFAAACKESLEEATEKLELEARRRALHGLERKKFDKGVPLIDPATGEQYVEREYSDTLMIFLLKAHKPDKYREKIDHRHGGNEDLPPIKFLRVVPPHERNGSADGDKP